MGFPLRIIFLVSLLLPSACTQRKETGPERERLADVVRRFVELSAGAKSGEDLQDLKKLSIGELKRAFDLISKEQFNIKYIENKLKVEDLKIAVHEASHTHARVTYIVTVKNDRGVQPTIERVEREVFLKHLRGIWLIESVRTLGTDSIIFTRGMVF